MEFYMRILQKKRHQAIYTSITAKTSADLVKLSSCHLVILSFSFPKVGHLAL